MESVNLKSIKAKNPAGREWFDPPEIIQTCNRWLFQLGHENFQLPANPYLIITIVLDPTITENRAELQSHTQFEYQPNWIERDWLEVFYYTREIPKEAAVLEKLCNSMLEDSLNTFAAYGENAQAISRVKEIIDLNGAQTMTGVGNPKKYKTGYRGAMVSFRGPAPYGGEAYLYVSDKDHRHAIKHKLCNFNEYQDVWDLLKKMTVKDDVLTITADTLWPDHLPKTFTIPMAKLLVDDGQELDIPPIIKKYMTDHERPF